MIQTLEINKIYNMDFREGINLLPQIKIIITDPPYNVNYKYDIYNDNLTDFEYIKLIANLKHFPLAIIHYPEETMRYFINALGIPNKVMVWAYNSNLPNRHFRLINYYNILPNLNKVKQPYKNLNDKRIKQRIKDGHNGARLYDWFNDINLVKNVSKDKYNHPCPIPVELYERIILLTTNKGDTVVDTFAGQGNFAIACINTGRNYIGFEISKTYVAIANERIKLKLLEDGKL